MPAALAYYESFGQNWERAALIKARPVAGDLALGAAFIEAIRPFVWRRHLDFAAIADIAGLKSELATFEARLEARVERTSNDLLRWVVGLIGFQALTLLAAVVGLARLGR